MGRSALDALPALRMLKSVQAVPGAQASPRSVSVAAGRGLPRGGQGRMRQLGANTNAMQGPRLFHSDGIDIVNWTASALQTAGPIDAQRGLT